MIISKDINIQGDLALICEIIAQKCQITEAEALNAYVAGLRSAKASQAEQITALKRQVKLLSWGGAENKNGNEVICGIDLGVYKAIRCFPIEGEADA